MNLKFVFIIVFSVLVVGTGIALLVLWQTDILWSNVIKHSNNTAPVVNASVPLTTSVPLDPIDTPVTTTGTTTPDTTTGTTTPDNTTVPPAVDQRLIEVARYTLPYTVKKMVTGDTGSIIAISSPTGHMIYAYTLDNDNEISELGSHRFNTVRPYLSISSDETKIHAWYEHTIFTWDTDSNSVTENSNVELDTSNGIRRIQGSLLYSMGYGPDNVFRAYDSLTVYVDSDPAGGTTQLSYRLPSASKIKMIESDLEAFLEHYSDFPEAISAEYKEYTASVDFEKNILFTKGAVLKNSQVTATIPYTTYPPSNFEVWHNRCAYTQNSKLIVRDMEANTVLSTVDGNSGNASGRGELLAYTTASSTIIYNINTGLVFVNIQNFDHPIVRETSTGYRIFGISGSDLVIYDIDPTE